MAQRITTIMMSNTYLRNLNNSMNRMMKLQYQMETNSRYEKLSDNPIAAVYGLQARSRLARIEQYKDNIADARAWITESETNVMQINEKIVQVAYEQVIYLTTDAKVGEDRSLAANLIKELRDHLVDTANAAYSDKYVYGGYDTVSPPFKVNEEGILCYKGVPMYSNTPGVDVSGDFQDKLIDGNDQRIQFEVGFSMYMDVNLTGVEVIGLNDKNIYKVLDDLYKALTATEERFIDPDDEFKGTEIVPSSTAEDIKGFIKPLQQAQSRMLSFLGELGGRTNRLDMLEARYALDEINYTQLMSNYEDADVEKVYMDLTTATNAYNAALSFGSRVIPMSLTNFLR